MIFDEYFDVKVVFFDWVLLEDGVVVINIDDMCGLVMVVIVCGCG